MKPHDRVVVSVPPPTRFGTPVGTTGTVRRVLKGQGQITELVEVVLDQHWDNVLVYIPAERLRTIP